MDKSCLEALRKGMVLEQKLEHTVKSDGFASGDVESMPQDWEWAAAGVFFCFFFFCLFFFSERNHDKIE